MLVDRLDLNATKTGFECNEGRNLTEHKIPSLAVANINNKPRAQYSVQYNKVDRGEQHCPTTISTCNT